MLKKITTLMLVLAVSFTTTAYASEASPSSNMDQELLKNGYPYELIQLFEPEQKQNLIDQGATYVSHEAIEDDIKDGENEDIIQSRSLDSSNNFSHILTLSQVKSDPGTVQFAVNYNWDWNYTPNFTAEDQWGIGWTDGFVLVDGSAKYSYKAFGRNIFGAEDTNGGVVQSGGVSSPGVGIAWKANLISGWSRTIGSAEYDYFTYRHKGWSTFNIKKGHDNSNNVVASAMSAMYFHKYLSAGGEIGFGGGSPYPSVSISPSWGYDSTKDSANKQFDWVQKDF